MIPRPATKTSPRSEGCTVTHLERHLEAARGWLLLRAPDEARRELDDLDETHRLDLEVLVLYVRIFRWLENWPRLMNVARLLYDGAHERVDGHLALAMATRHLHGPERAIGILMEATEQFPNSAEVYYNLACCEAVTGELDLARRWLEQAFKLVPGLRDVARVDVDLAALR